MGDMTPSLMIAFNMRAPDWGPPATRLYDAAVEMAAWADKVGFDTVMLSEHHVTSDGYLPSPLVLGAGIATRTKQVKIKISVVLATLMHPLHLAEDAAVLDLLSHGRLRLTLGAGYRKEEFLAFGVNWKRRPSMMVEIVDTLRKAWTGEEFDFRGVPVRVLPRPFQNGGPDLALAGTSVGSARRAAALDMPYEPLGDQFYEVYLEELRRLGKPLPPMSPIAAEVSQPSFVHIATDPEAAWGKIGPHVLHNANEYAAYAQRKDLTPFKAGSDPDVLLETGAAKVLTPQECIDLCRKIGPSGAFRLNPLEGGIDPELGWESLKLFENEVLPVLRGD